MDILLPILPLSYIHKHSLSLLVAYAKTTEGLTQ